MSQSSPRQYWKVCRDCQKTKWVDEDDLEKSEFPLSGGKARPNCKKCKNSTPSAKAAVARWRVNHADEYSALAQILKSNQRARHYKAVGELTAQDWMDVLVKYGPQCLRCGSLERVSLDHVKPLNQGGSNTKDNLQPLCSECNSWKGEFTVDYRKDGTAMTSRLLTTDILRQVNTASRRARLNHVLTPGVLEKLDEEGTHVANHEMFHGDGDGACIRTIILVKLQGRQEPYTTTLDMTIKDWNSLVTADAYLQATTERMS